MTNIIFYISLFYFIIWSFWTYNYRNCAFKFFVGMENGMISIAKKNYLLFVQCLKVPTMILQKKFRKAKRASSHMINVTWKYSQISKFCKLILVYLIHMVAIWKMVLCHLLQVATKLWMIFIALTLQRFVSQIFGSGISKKCSENLWKFRFKKIFVCRNYNTLGQFGECFCCESHERKKYRRRRIC